MTTARNTFSYQSTFPHGALHMLAQCRKPSLASARYRIDCKLKYTSRRDTLKSAATQTSLQEIQAGKPSALSLLFPDPTCLVYEGNKIFDTAQPWLHSQWIICSSLAIWATTHVAVGNIQSGRLISNPASVCLQKQGSSRHHHYEIHHIFSAHMEWSVVLVSLHLPSFSCWIIFSSSCYQRHDIDKSW